LAQALAKEEGKPVNARHFERTISVTTQFKKDVSEDSEISVWLPIGVSGVCLAAVAGAFLAYKW